jgi:DHA2 family multidrug resistance protein
MSPLSPLERIFLLLSAGLATFMIVLDYSIANISIPYIAGDLGVSNDQGTYVITSFAVGNAIGLAGTGWVTKRVGPVRLVILSILLFTLFSWTCGLSPNLTMLVISRFIQGLVAGPVIPLSQSLIVTFATEKSRSRDIAIWSTIIITAPVIGPILGGYISDWYFWTWIFYINIPVGLLCAGILWLIMRPHETKTDKTPIDIAGFILLTIGVACLQILLDKGQQWDWWNSYRIRALSIGSVVSFTFLAIREVWHPNPFLNLRLLSIPSYAVSIVCLMVSYGIYFGTIVIVPLWLQEYMNYHVEWAGIAVSALGIAPILLGMSSPWIMRKIGTVPTLAVGFLCFAAGCFYSMFFTTDIDIQHVAFGRFLFGFGFIFYLNPLVNLSIQGISPAQLPNATGMFHFVRAMVGAVGTSIFTTFWVRRTIFYHFRTGELLTPFNPFTPQARDPKSLAMLNDLMDQQAAMLAINDAFYMMGWLFIGLIVLLMVWLFLSRKKPISPTPSVSVISD